MILETTAPEANTLQETLDNDISERLQRRIRIKSKHSNSIGQSVRILMRSGVPALKTITIKHSAGQYNVTSRRNIKFHFPRNFRLSYLPQRLLFIQDAWSFRSTRYSGIPGSRLAFNVPGPLELVKMQFHSRRKHPSSARDNRWELGHSMRAILIA